MCFQSFKRVSQPIRSISDLFSCSFGFFFTVIFAPTLRIDCDVSPFSWWLSVNREPAWWIFKTWFYFRTSYLKTPALYFKLNMLHPAYSLVKYAQEFHKTKMGIQVTCWYWRLKHSMSLLHLVSILPHFRHFLL